MIAGYNQVVHTPPATSSFVDVNILGTDFFYTHRIVKVEDYVGLRAKLFFHYDAGWELVTKS